MSRIVALVTPLKPVTAMYIDTGLRHVLVEAAITVPFGIHRDATGEGYSVSHIATGYKIAEGFKTVDAANALCNELRCMKKISWEFTDKAAVKNWSAYARKKIVGLIATHGGMTGGSTARTAR
ncbi:hypothetical protein LN565_01145 [Xanthomonas euvesicatoria pv. euvesicatoria]|uniref:hypothetical protein n=1 Tax=Xanthomonas TaxID=338 RepID=UPI00062D3A05|nr:MULTISPECIES: hypothetical protein [Xanthomonas]KLA50913.1 hypothetical protein XEUV683_17880 [Xanthomonas euvesicatoria]KLA59003.1 hypothetical protein XEUV684_12760 [Xanthomonas euvesicatoria]KLA60003.1 hypothetical protein XEUV685_01760 [Xanthomonas euvesicatoria]KLA63229.1 hypothetical protein XEUV689_20105 [Xanthomonas euvesicatoria]KLA66243.1 hypothetical protein XEUV695_13505 [Xanthomonas euvesicatoria]